jgi:hypothetical protein
MQERIKSQPEYFTIGEFINENRHSGAEAFIINAVICTNAPSKTVWLFGEKY